MAIQETKFNNEKISIFVKDNYGIIVNKIEKINKGRANIYKIYSNNKKYILKEFGEDKEIETIIKESKIVEYMKNKGIKTPVYIKTIDNKYYSLHENNPIVLQEYIEGYTMENNTGDYDKVIESARILGKLVQALMDYNDISDDSMLKKKFTKESVKKGISKIKELKQNLKNDDDNYIKINNDLNKKIQISEWLLDNFNFDILDKITIVNSHGDYSVQQLIYNDDDETSVIDFETAKKLPIVWEIMRSYSYVDIDAKDGNFNLDNLVDYFKEFSKYFKLNKYDLRYSAYLYLIQIIGSTFGYKEYNKNHEQKELLNFGFFRTKLCEYLFENLDVIGEKLEMEMV